MFNKGNVIKQTMYSINFVLLLRKSEVCIKNRLLLTHSGNNKCLIMLTKKQQRYDDYLFLRLCLFGHTLCTLCTVRTIHITYSRFLCVFVIEYYCLLFIMCTVLNTTYIFQFLIHHSQDSTYPRKLPTFYTIPYLIDAHMKYIYR